MNAILIIRRLHQHRAWVNQQLLQAAESIPQDQLHQAFEMGQGTLWKSFTHLYAAEYVWLEALTGNEDPLTPGDLPGKLPGNQEGEDAVSSLSELQDRWQALDQRWSFYLENLTAESLEEVVYKVGSLSGRRQAAHRSDILLHVCTHAQYTTAQIMNMMRHVGMKELPDPMLITLARQGMTAAD